MERQPPGFRGPTRHGDWLTFHSPLRDDKHPSFGVKPDSENDPGGFRDHATGDAGSIADLARRLGVDPRISNSNGHTPRPSLAAFCLSRRLDRGRLCETFGVVQTTWNNRPALRYPTPVGIDRIKYLDGAKPKYHWRFRGGRRHWYGLKEAFALGGDVLYVVNGEPSVWACILAGVPAVCLCGGEANTPTAELVTELSQALGRGATFQRVKVVYDVAEPHDQPNKGSRAVAAALRAVGLDAEALRLPDSLGPGGDVDDLRRHVGDAELASALGNLERLGDANAKSESDSGAGAKAEDAPRAVTISLADVTPQKLRWVWPGRIARGKLTILVGSPGQGKSFATLDIASRLSTGTPLPGEAERPEIVSTLLLALEDDLADTVRPRLDALHADPSRIHALTGIKQKDMERLPLLDRDLGALEEAVKRTGAGLIIVDPINAYMGKVDGSQDIDMRSVLTPLTALAARTGVAVLAVTHTNKRSEGDPLHRVMGSLAYVAAARSVLAVGSDPDAPGRRVLLQIKSNLAALAPGLGFRVVDGVLVWDSDPVTATPETIFGGANQAQAPQEGSALAEAAEFLRTVLAEGRKTAKAVYAEAEGVRISTATLRRAKEALGVKAVRDKFGDAGHWWWELPPEAPSPLDAQRRSSSPSGVSMSTLDIDEHLSDDSDDMEYVD